MSEHAVKDCQGQFVELHRIDPAQSRPVLGSVAITEDGARTFTAKTNAKGEPKLGEPKYDEKVIVNYCPTCGAKEVEPWTE